MKRRSRKTARRREPIRFWTYEEAKSASPYIRSLVQSLREHTLTYLAARQHLQELNDRPGRPNRAALIEEQEANRDVREAEERLEEVSGELDALDLAPLDPIQGQALAPFVHDDQLAWYVFDLFDADPVRFWRYQDDPLETRRPIRELSLAQSV